MRPVAVVGIGKTRFGAFPDRDLRSLAVEAGEKCLQNAHINPSQVEAFYLGNFAGPSFVGQNHLAPYISNALGIHEVPATRIEAACASSGSAFFHAVSGVAAGLYDIVMVAGVEKMTSQPTPRVTEILASAGDCSGEIRAGSTFPSLFATIEQALAGKPVADPLNLYDCSLISDGAAAVIVVSADRARDFCDKPVRVLGIAQASDYMALDQKPDITTFPAVKAAAAKAYKMAGVEPADIELGELHDCFTIAEIVE